MKELIQNKPLFPEILWKRPVHFYKSQAGRIFVLAGSARMSGAAILTCEAVFRSGTGVLVLGFPEGLKIIYKEILPEAMMLPLPETPGKTLSKKGDDLILEQVEVSDVLIIGPGLSANAETIQLIWELVFKIEKPTVLDADGLGALAKGIEVLRAHESEKYMEEYFRKRKGPLIITPHPGEASKILKAANLADCKGTKTDANYIESNKERIAPLLGKKLNAITILKGHDTIIYDPRDDRMIVNRSGGPELATAGSGDVLAGIVGSFIGQNPDKIFEAASTAVFLHGLAGKIGKDNASERSVIASDIIRYLPKAIRQAEESMI